MSIIGDALNRAEEDSRPSRNGLEQVPAVPVGHRVGGSTVANTYARKQDTDPPVSETVLSLAKGIAHPAPPASVSPKKESPVLGMVLLSLLGLAGYLIVYPGWIDSLWNFESHKMLAVSRTSKTGPQPTRTSSVGSEMNSVPTPLMQAAPVSGPGQPEATQPPFTIERTTTSPSSEVRLNRDPPARSVPRSRFQVDGVMLGGRRTLAVVNGAIVGVGDEVDGATVRAIVDNAVALEIDGRIRRIPLRAPQPASSQPRASQERPTPIPRP